MIVIGGILATASHGNTINGMFWMMTVARGIVGFGKTSHTPPPLPPISAQIKLTLPRRRRRIPRLLNLRLRSSKRSNPQAPRPSLHNGDQLPALLRRPIRRLNLPNRPPGLQPIALQHRMARLLRDRLYLAIDGLLLPHPNAELGSVPPGRDQTACSVHACFAVLLEGVDRDMWCLVPLRYIISQLFLLLSTSN
jgi:hypothetical protein